MARGKLAWRMNPNVRRTLQFVQKLQDTAYTYHHSSDESVRQAALCAWEAAVSELGLGGEPTQARTPVVMKPRAA